jgi:hypothetical protein
VPRPKPQDADDEWLEWIHEETAHNAQAWYYCAETLYESAEFLLGGLHAGPAGKLLTDKGKMDSHYNSHGLLLGYALECICKGLWVAQGGHLAAKGKLTGIRGASDHDLLALVRKVGVTLSTGERDVVNRLSYWITTAGRYPVPVRSTQMKSRRVRGRGLVDPEFMDATDWATARRVTHRMLGELRTQMYR